MYQCMMTIILRKCLGLTLSAMLMTWSSKRDKERSVRTPSSGVRQTQETPTKDESTQMRFRVHLR